MPPTGTISNGAVQAAIQSDAGPDVILTNSGIGRISVVKNAKQVMPLTEQYEKRGWKDKIYPWLYTELKGQFGGEIYEVPDGLDALGGRRVVLGELDAAPPLRPRRRRRCRSWRINRRVCRSEF